MMDKQKQIEEMGVDVSIAWQKANHRRCTMGVTRPPLCDVLAEELAKMSYRKIPENAVVLNVSEYVRLKSIEENIDRVIKQKCKETAEKFAERLKSEFKEEDFWCDFVAWKIDEIANEFTEG